MGIICFDFMVQVFFPICNKSWQMFLFFKLLQTLNLAFSLKPSLNSSKNVQNRPLMLWNLIL